MTLHTYKTRVYLEDTDSYGAVYHASYLRFAERARTHILYEWNLSHQAIQRDMEIRLMVRHCQIHYHAPAFVDEILEVETNVSSTRAASLIFYQKILREDHLIATLEVEVACVNAAGKPTRLPLQIKKNILVG